MCFKIPESQSKHTACRQFDRGRFVFMVPVDSEWIQMLPPVLSSEQCVPSCQRCRLSMMSFLSC